MQRTVRVSLAACVGALALAGAGLSSAKAADVGVPQYQAPPPAAYGPPPVQEGYAYPPPPAYVYPPPPPPVAYYYGPPAYDVYYGPGPYWRGGPRFAYGYGFGHWGHGHWGHGWHR